MRVVADHHELPGLLQAPPCRIFRPIRRRESARHRGQLGRRGGRAACSSPLGCLLERGRDRLVRVERGQRQVASPLLRVGDDLCESGVRLALRCG